MTGLHWIILIFVVLIAFIIWMIVLEAQDEERKKAEWQKFVDKNDCHVVEEKDETSASTIGPIIGSQGIQFGLMTTSTPAQECWLCANGRRYWKKAGMAIDRRKEGK